MFVALATLFFLHAQIRSQFDTDIDNFSTVSSSHVILQDYRFLIFIWHRIESGIEIETSLYRRRATKRCDRDRETIDVRSLIMKKIYKRCVKSVLLNTYFFFQGFKVFFFTVGGFYIAYLLLLILRAYSELRSMPYFGKHIS